MCKTQLARWSILATVTALAVFSACQNEGGKQAPARENDMYELSELAALMERMYEGNREIRDAIRGGELPDSIPAEFYDIHDAEATDPADKDKTYHQMADMWIRAMKEVEDADKDEAVPAFNNMVKNCVDCHKMYCEGPIPRIKKLYIRE